MGVLLVAGLLIGLARVATLGTLALTDNTEARYGAVGWHMFQSGNWVTPQLYLSGKLVPFWAKPPLFFWLTALSFEACGVSEWSARLPNLLLAAVIVAATVGFGRRFWGPRVGGLAGVILASSGLFFVMAGTCVLDMALAGCVCLAMMSFALFADGKSNAPWWGRSFFLALGLGCLAKGPVAVVLVGLAVGGWIAATARWGLLRRLPWFSGSLIAGVVALPWYLLAERATPGFLEYFIVHEHILRYVTADYGDMYGDGRIQPYGASWVMLLVTFLPWSPILIRYGIDRWRRRGETAVRTESRDAWLAYALIWGVTPAVFFTFCRQILVTYMLPGFPGLALVTAVVLVRWLDSSESLTLLRGLRTYAFVLVVLLAAAWGVQFAMGLPIGTVLVATAGVAVFAAVLRNAFRRNDSLRLLAAVGVGATLLIGITIFNAAPFANEAFSTKRILEAVAATPRPAEQPVYLPMSDEYSADFYQEACLSGRIDHDPRKGIGLTRQKAEQGADEIFVFRRKDWQTLEPALQDRLSLLVETAHWIAFRTQKEPQLSSRGSAAASGN